MKTTIPDSHLSDPAVQRESYYCGFLVICDDTKENMIRRTLAVRQVFATYAEAVAYGDSIPPKRRPEIIGCLRPLKIQKLPL